MVGHNCEFQRGQCYIAITQFRQNGRARHFLQKLCVGGLVVYLIHSFYSVKKMVGFSRAFCMINMF